MSSCFQIEQKPRSMAALLLAVAVGILTCTSQLHAQQVTSDERSVAVGLYISPPFVMEKDGQFSGMAVELWDVLADKQNLRSQYKVFPTLRDLVEATSRKEIDVAVTNLTITQGRAQSIDFTQPWFDSGLRILVNEDRSAGFWDVVTGLKDSGHLRAYGWIVLVIAVATVLLTVFDRYFDKEFPRRWREGLAESFYSVMSIATSGRMPARKNLFGWIGRAWQGLWLVCGVAVLAYVTSSVTSVMTTLSLTNQINSLSDLPGKTVGVFTGSVAEEFARESILYTRSYADIDGAAEALRNGRIAAVIGDAPVLEYYVHTHPDAALTVVGPIFEPDKYAFGLAHGSGLTRPLTIDLLGAHEQGVVDNLRAKYFGDSP